MEVLAEWFGPFNSCLVAFSAGVDSSVVALAAKQALGSGAIAVTSVSPSFARREILEAKRIAKEIGIQHLIVPQDDLRTEGYVANQVSRCYFCRSNLAGALLPIKEARKLDTWVDGTHLDDISTPRPGIKALRDNGFRAPLVEIGFRKHQVRSMARAAGLSNSERPSESCLSSRVAYGQRIDEATLKTIEAAELAVKGITGANIVRVRTFGSKAVVEVSAQSIAVALRKLPDIRHALTRLGYEQVEVDPGGYKPGRMLSFFLTENR